MNKYFPGISKIEFEGPKSKNPLSFKQYDENEVVLGKTMKEHLKFASSYWHTFCGTGADPFGPGTQPLPWLKESDPIKRADDTMEAAFEFFYKIGTPYYCSHDRDMAPAGRSIEESEDILWSFAEKAKKYQSETGIKMLFGSANLFSNPAYMCGAATNPDFSVLCNAATQVKTMIDVVKFLDADNYVFWGGREGYDSLLNTDMKRELSHLGMFLKQAVAYAKKIGFEGNILIEPKPMEPTKHQYDFDSATVIGFLKEHGLEKDIKLNIEANHATLAGHTFAHELQVCADAGVLGSIDINRGDAQNGWDTDQFPTNLYDTVEAMMVVLQNGGLGKGGLNFDSKTRRTSTDLSDIFYGYIGGMDAFARGLKIAAKILNNSPLPAIKEARYSSYDSGKGKEFEEGLLDMEALYKIGKENGQPNVVSSRQELYENIINECIY